MRFLPEQGIDLITAAIEMAIEDIEKHPVRFNQAKELCGKLLDYLGEVALPKALKRGTVLVALHMAILALVQSANYHNRTTLEDNRTEGKPATIIPFRRK